MVESSGQLDLPYVLATAVCRVWLRAAAPRRRGRPRRRPACGRRTCGQHCPPYGRSVVVLVPRRCRHAAVIQGATLVMPAVCPHSRALTSAGSLPHPARLFFGPEKRRLRKPRSPARANGAVQRARIIVPVTRATIVLIEVGTCAMALWTRPRPTTSVTQANASITTLKCIRRLTASSEKLFMTCSPKDYPCH